MAVLPRAGKAIYVLLAISTILSLIILAYDSLLWFDNRLNGHAYLLSIFTVVNIAVAALVILKPKRGLRYAWLWSLIFFLVVLLDPLSAFQIGLTLERFTLYLYGIAPLPPSPGTEVPCPLYCPPLRFSFTALVIVLLLQVLTSWKAVRAARQTNRLT